MLRIYRISNWFNLVDKAHKESMFELAAVRVIRLYPHCLRKSCVCGVRFNVVCQQRLLGEVVIPAKAGIQALVASRSGGCDAAHRWIPAFAGMTGLVCLVTHHFESHPPICGFAGGDERTGHGPVFSPEAQRCPACVA